MGLIPLRIYEDWISLKRMQTPDSWKRCLYCKRVFNKGDYYIGNSRKKQFCCRKCAIPLLESAIADADNLKGMAKDMIDDLRTNEEQYNKEEMLNDL